MARLHAPSRRKLLLASGSLFAWAYLPKLARAEGRDPRFLTIVLRGALDGLATVAPVGDPDWVSLRGDNALTLDSKASALKLDDFFALNPAMPKLHRMFKANEAIVVHAAATSYRERSHFDGQDVAAASKSQARPTAGGSTGCWWALRPRTVSVRTAAGPSPSDRWRRWSCVDQRRCCLGGRGEFCRQATTRSCDCWISIGIPMSTSRASLKAARSSRQLRRPAAWIRSRSGRLPAPTSRSCVPISPRPLAPPRSSWRSPTVRASARSRSTVVTHIIMKASRLAGWRNCWARSMTLSPRSGKTWDRRGARPWWCSSPNSAARRASTVLMAPTTAPPPSCCSPAERSKAVA